MKALHHRCQLILALVLSTLSVTEHASAQDRYASLKAADFAQLWLENNCGVGEDNALAKHLRLVVAEVEPLLIRAWQEGPPAEKVAEVRKAAAGRFSMMQKALGSGATFGLSPEDLKVGREQTSETFAESEVKNYATRYKSQALVGLGMTAGPEAEKILEAAAKDADPTLSHIARLVAEAKKRPN